MDPHGYFPLYKSSTGCELMIKRLQEKLYIYSIHTKAILIASHQTGVKAAAFAGDVTSRR